MSYASVKKRVAGTAAAKVVDRQLAGSLEGAPYVLFRLPSAAVDKPWLGRGGNQRSG